MDDNLKLLCSEYREKIKEPLAITAPDGREFVVASDGSMFLAVPLSFVSKTYAKADGNILKYIGECLDEVPPDNAILTTAERLIEWAGPPVWEIECVECEGCGTLREQLDCAKCDGKGDVECLCATCGNAHDVGCGLCDGTGTQTEKTDVPCDECDGKGKTKHLQGTYRPGEIAGLAVDLRRFARLCAFAQGECKVWALEQRVNIIGQSGWRGVLMMMLLGKDEPRSMFKP
jgi:hypothetical protein